MGVVVQKYGGTSVGSIERIRAVAARVQRARQQGQQVVVVVSAMAGETDRLLRLAREVSATPRGAGSGYAAGHRGNGLHCAGGDGAARSWAVRPNRLRVRRGGF